MCSFHFGMPEPALLERVRRTGARIVSSATTVAEARVLPEPLLATSARGTVVVPAPDQP